MTRLSLAAAMLVAVLIVDNVVLFSTFEKNRRLEKQVEELQVKIGRYISSADPTVTSEQFRRPQNRLLHEVILSKFLAQAVLLKTAGELAVQPRQAAEVLAVFKPTAQQCAALNQLDQKIAADARAVYRIWTPEQLSWLAQHAPEVQEKMVEILAASKRDASVAEAFSHFFEAPPEPAGR